jgi:hypothetical protein
MTNRSPQNAGSGRFFYSLVSRLIMLNSSIIDLLAACQYNSAAACQYDIMAGGLIWDDEVPKSVDRPSNLRASVYLRSVIAYRASLSLGAPRVELESDWNELKQLMPNWPGFRDDRIFGKAQRLLKIHKYKEAKLLDQALGELDPPCPSDGRSH